MKTDTHLKSKKIKVQYNKDTTYHVDSFVWDLCYRVYEITLEKETLSSKKPLEQSLDWYATKYKGGVGIEEAKNIVRKNSLINFPVVEIGYAYVLEQIKKYGIGKRRSQKKGKGRQAEYNPTFIYEMAKHYVLTRIKQDPKKGWSLYLENLKERYPDKEKREKRLGDKAQVNAYIMRALLRALEEKTELPKIAYG